jgi:hypothetical protein
LTINEEEGDGLAEVEGVLADVLAMEKMDEDCRVTGGVIGEGGRGVFVACVDDDEDAGARAAEMSRGGSLANLMVETSPSSSLPQSGPCETT